MIDYHSSHCRQELRFFALPDPPLVQTCNLCRLELHFKSQRIGLNCIECDAAELVGGHFVFARTGHSLPLAIDTVAQSPAGRQAAISIRGIEEPVDQAGGDRLAFLAIILHPF